jgi:cobalt-precorrin-5B (C1)-methyltransferase
MKTQTASLRSGFTTGTAAAAAVKAALTRILSGESPDFVDILLLTGDSIRIPVHDCRMVSGCQARATVIKDAGDDPDVTHGALIGAVVTIGDTPGTMQILDCGKGNAWENVTITGGEGVGLVTLPGLEIPPGQAAINPGPRKMILQAVADVMAGRPFPQTVSVEVFVPRGRALAEKTLNARLGIMGGISILGTTGIVRPMSHEAYEATIVSALSVARAGGCTRAVLTTGRRSERFARSAIPDLPQIAFIQIGDFFRISLEAATQKGFAQVTLAVLFGKAIKMAQGFGHTHAARSGLSLAAVSEWAMAATGDRQFSRRLLLAHTAREALSIITEAHPSMLADVVSRMVLSARRFSGADVAIQSMIFDYDGKLLYTS